MYFKFGLILTAALFSLNSFADVAFRREVLSGLEKSQTRSIAKRKKSLFVEAYQKQDYLQVLAQINEPSDLKADTKNLMLAEAYSELGSSALLLDHSISSLQKNINLEAQLFPLIADLIAEQQVFISPALKSRFKILPESSLTKQVFYLITQDPKLSLKVLNAKLNPGSPFEKMKAQAQIIEAFKTKNDLEISKLSSQVKSQNLFLARLYYGRGDFEKAIAIYEKMNSKHPQFIQSREELAWAYLMNKNLDASLGLTRDLLQSGVAVSSRLESRFLAAYAYLKACHFDEVKSQMSLYQKEMQKVSEQLAEGKRQQTWTMAYVPNQLLLLAKQEQALNQEILIYPRGAKSVSALNENLAALKKEKASVTKVAFINYEKLVAESFLKMQFLRLELLSLLHQIENKKVKTSDMLTENQLSKKSEKAPMNFAANDKDIWGR